MLTEILSISNEFIFTQWNNIKWKIHVLISAMTNLWNFFKIIIYVKYNCDITSKLLHVVKNTSEDQQTTTNKQRLCFKQEDDIEGEVTTQGNTWNMIWRSYMMWWWSNEWTHKKYSELLVSNEINAKEK